MKKIIVLISFCAPLVALCQNLTGTWEGSGGGVTYIKMVIRHVGDSVYGYTYDEGGGYCKATFAAKYTSGKKRLVGRGVIMLMNSGTHVLADYDLVYSKEPRGEYLRENLGEEGFLERMFGPGSRQYLRKTSNQVDFSKKPAPASAKPQPATVTPPVIKKEPVQKAQAVPPVVKKEPVKKAPSIEVKPTVAEKPVSPAPVIKKDPPVRTDTVAKVASPKKIERMPAPVALVKKKDERSSKLVQTIYTNVDTVKMFVYDNGEIDNDTVTIFLDNAIILDHYRISDKAKELYLPVAKDGQHSVELFANNLGSIPPNTALIIIMAGKKRYELRASYDLETNAQIIIQYKE